MQAGGVYSASIGRIAATIPANMAGTSSGGGHDGTVSVTYDAATGGYTIRDGSLTRSFTAAQRSSSSNAVVTMYEQTNGNRQDMLALFNPGAGNSTLALSYVSYGAWQTVVDNGSSADLSQRFFVYGVRQAASAPSTGSASYRTTVDGFWTTSVGYYSLAGSSDFTADFSAMTVSTNLTLIGTNIDTGTIRSLGQFAGSGTIAATGGGFSGSFTHLNGDGPGNGSAGGTLYSGGFDGAFFGPQGQEMGYSFRLQGADGAATGAVVGKAQ